MPLSLTSATNQGQVESWATAVLGDAIGSSTMSNVSTDITSYGGLSNAFNAYYQELFGSSAAATTVVVNTIISNLNLTAGNYGLTTTTAGAISTNLQAVLNSTPYAQRGAAIQTWLSQVAQMNSDPTYGAAATAVNTADSNAYSYVQAGNAADIASTVAAPAAAVTNAATAASTVTFNLTTGVDTKTANTFNATNVSVGTSTSTLTSFDALTGSSTGTNVLNLVSDGTALASGYTLTNIPTVSISASADQTINAASTNGWTGVTALNITQPTGTAAPAAGTTIAVLAPTAVALSDTGVALAINPVATEFSALTIDGGTSAIITASGTDGSAAAKLIGDIIVGGTTIPTGTVSVTSTETIAATAANSSASGDVIVNGTTGTAVTINSTVTASQTLATAAVLAVNSVAAGKASMLYVTGATGAVNVTDATVVNSSGAGITVNADGVKIVGGSIDTVTETASNSVTSDTAIQVVDMGAVTITGGSTTTSVSITQAAKATGAAAVTAVAAVTPGVVGASAVTAGSGVQGAALVSSVSGNAATSAANAKVTVADAVDTIADATNTTAGSTITTVSLNNYANSTFSGSKLSTLTLAGTGGTLSITNGAGSAATNTTLTLNLNGLSDTGAGGTNNTITDASANEITTLAITTGTAASTLDGFIDSNLATITIAGTQVVTFGTAGTPINATNDAALTKVSVSGSAGLTWTGASTLGSSLSLTTTSSGTITATLDDTTQTFVGSSTGKDVIWPPSAWRRS